VTEKLNHVSVLGAGVCGLAAAMELLRSGAAERVSVFEVEDRPGGMARTVYDPSGLKADMGPHRIHTELPEIDALLTELVDEELMWIERRSAMHVEGRLLDYPLSVRSVLRLFGPVEFARMGLSAAWAKMNGLWQAPGDNFEAHMIRHFGERVYRRVLEPYSAKVWKIPPREISVKAAEVRVSAGSMTKLARRILTGGREKPGQETALRRFRYLRGGVESLVLRLAEKVRESGGEILCGRRIESLALEDDGTWRVRHSHGEARSSGVVSTIPVTSLPRMLRRSEALSLPERELAALEYLAIYLVFLIIDKPTVSDNHWLYFPDPDLCFNRGYEPRRFWDDPEAPAAQTMLCLEITARPGTDLHAANDEQLASRVESDIVRAGLVREEEIVKSFVRRLPFGYPLYDRPADENLARVFEFLRRWPGLVTTGRQGLFSHNNMDHSMHMGLEAARALASGSEGVDRWYDNVERLRHFRIVD
jgi:protoporphyrinogen oxidase